MTGKQWGGALALVVLVLGGLWTVRMIQESRRGDAVPLTQTQDIEDGDANVVRLFNPVPFEEFSITDLTGRRISSREWRGKVVLVNFWATWCPPCRAEIPDLIKLQNKYHDKIIIIGLSEDEGSVEDVKQFVREHAMNYTVAMTPPEIRKLFRGVAALPTTFVLDGEGRLVQKHVGQLNPPAIEREARVVAGLDTNVKIERVDSSDKVRVEHAAEAKNIPGVDLASLTAAQKKSVVDALLSEDCTCGCALTLAVCRLDDPTCPVSLPLAKAVVERYSGTSR